MSSVQAREELVELLARDLLGPWDGPEEELHHRSPGPRERYLVGQLGPRASATDPEPPDADLDVDLGDGADATDPEVRELFPTHAAGRLWASSMGLSFVVPGDVDAVAVTVEWGHYRRIESETQLKDDGTGGRRVWKRHPVRAEIELRLDRGRSSRREELHPDYADVQLAVTVRERGERRVVDLALINGQDEPSSNRDEAWLFQPTLAVTALDGDSSIFCAMNDPLEDPAANGAANAEQAVGEDAHLTLLYRNHLEFAAGRNVAVHAETRAGQRRAWRLSTAWLPTYDVPQTVAPQAADTPELTGLELGMERLAELSRDELVPALAPLADGYRGWLAARRADAAELPAHLRAAAQTALERAEAIAGRIRAGIDLLADRDDALEAFRFANRAMAAQRRHTLIVGRRGADPDESYEDAEGAVRAAETPAWRPFQLAFVLVNLPGLTDPTHPERAASHDAVVDLLFFPTGGGKTEAYLGLVAYTCAIRRLQGVVGSGELARDGRDGVAALMRYTLRLLTAQQFQRAASLICACEMLRQQAAAAGDRRLGDEPFRIGLWVGTSVSPNWYEEAKEQVERAREGRNVRSSALQVLACPWCGTALRADRDLHPDDTRRRILLFCGDENGRCPFSRRRSPEEGLPILTVDEEIYRLTPDLVIATVDKLARLPWAGYAGTLFGRVSRRCPRHGYRHDDMDARTGCRDRHHKKDGRPATQTHPVVRLRPPDLIIQDELHLISGALGTTVGLFEAAVNELCTWPVETGGGLREAGPKIVASTATVKRAAEQVHQLFARRLAVFPPPVLDQGDTFFSRQIPVEPGSPGRRYLGVCAHGVRLKSAEIRLAEILLLAGQQLLDSHGADAADPYLTLVGYFNATRELAGMRRYLDDDVATRVRRHGRIRGMAERLRTLSSRLHIQELTSRVSSDQIAQTLRHLGVPFEDRFDTTAAKNAIAEEYRRAHEEKRDSDLPERRSVPLDTVLATSMLQVGVDVPRLGLMTVTGQPKNTTEYIQATSRIGRDPARPGLVVTLYNWTRPRDLAHYEHFEHFHASLYREVEALSVTPYARRALDRGFAGTFVAAVRNMVERFSRNRDAHDVPLDGAVVDRVRARLRSRAEYVAGEAGGDYLAEKAAALLDSWAAQKNQDFRLGYRTAHTPTENLVGLLESPGGQGWTDRTVAHSMRETENEINLLLPKGTLADVSAYEGPAWGRPPDGSVPDGSVPDGSGDDGEQSEDIPQADELGDTWTDRPGASR